MAAATCTLVMTCQICGTANTYTAAKEAASGENDALKLNKFKKCLRCGNPFKFKLSSVALKHTAGVGASNSTLTHTITNGSISSAASA